MPYANEEDAKRNRKNYYQQNREEYIARVRAYKRSPRGREASRRYHETHRKQEAERQRRYRLENPEIVRAIERKKYYKHRDKQLHSAWTRQLKSHGVTEEWYTEQFTKQNGLCAICFQSEVAKDPKRGKVRRLSVDHNHTTEKVRGLLCSACNLALGIVETRPEWISRTIAYLEFHDA